MVQSSGVNVCLPRGLFIPSSDFILAKHWFLYVLLCSDGTYYTGVTTDVRRRLKEHNTSHRGAKYTKTRRPVEVVYWTDFEDRSSAQKAEYKFKQLTRKQKEKTINEIRLNSIITNDGM